MTDPDRRQNSDDDDARRDALDRGEGGKGATPDAMSGEGGADGMVKNQEDAAQ
jgi:hypothetical protein